jgi:hypothetical protein
MDKIPLHGLSKLVQQFQQYSPNDILPNDGSRNYGLHNDVSPKYILA